MLGFALAFALAPAGCGESGDGTGSDASAVDSAAVQRTAAATLRAGMTQDEVRSRLGEPRTRVTMDGGQERWTYYGYDAEGQIMAKTRVIFGDDGRVLEIDNAGP